MTPVYMREIIFVLHKEILEGGAHALSVFLQ